MSASPTTRIERSPLARHWVLDPEIAFLNHGSFGSCTRTILELQQEWRDRLERQPVQFYVRDLEALLDEGREALAAFVGADPEGLAWVPNVTLAINSVLQSLDFAPDDELLVTDHEYNASRNILDFVAQRSGARVVVAPLPFPLDDPSEVILALRRAVTPRTRLLLIDHITSQTGLVLPLREIVEEMDRHGVDVLVDGAHGPGMVELDLRALGVAYYGAANHKWLCGPKSSGFLWVREDRRAGIRPVIVSHGANSTRADRSRFLVEFEWLGTIDPTPMLCVVPSLRLLEGLFEGGWPEIRRHNRTLALEGRQILQEALGVESPAPASMIGSLAALPLPDGSPEPPASALYADPLQEQLLRDWKVEVPIVPFPAAPRRLIRISAAPYNHPSEYRRLAEGLQDLFG